MVDSYVNHFFNVYGCGLYYILIQNFSIQNFTLHIFLSIYKPIKSTIPYAFI